MNRCNATTFAHLGKSRRPHKTARYDKTHSVNGHHHSLKTTQHDKSVFEFRLILLTYAEPDGGRSSDPNQSPRVEHKQQFPLAPLTCSPVATSRYWLLLALYRYILDDHRNAYRYQSTGGTPRPSKKKIIAVFHSYRPGFVQIFNWVYREVYPLNICHGWHARTAARAGPACHSRQHQIK